MSVSDRQGDCLYTASGEAMFIGCRGDDWPAMPPQSSLDAPAPIGRIAARPRCSTAFLAWRSSNVYSPFSRAFSLRNALNFLRSGWRRGGHQIDCSSGASVALEGARSCVPVVARNDAAPGPGWGLLGRGDARDAFTRCMEARQYWVTE